MKVGLKLLLINPDASRTVYQGLGDTLATVGPTLWSSLINYNARDRGDSVPIFDVEGISRDEVAAFVAVADAQLASV